MTEVTLPTTTKAITASPKGKIIGRKKPLKKLRKLKNGTIKETSKLDLFLQEFLKNGGNGTEAALKVFNCSSRVSAANMASMYLKKAKGIARVYMEQRGYSYGRLLELAGKKAEESKTPEFFDRLLKMLGYDDFMPDKNQKPNSVVNIIQTEKNVLSKYTDEDIEDLEPIEVVEEVKEEKKGKT